MIAPRRRPDALAIAILIAVQLWVLAPLLTPPFAADALVGTDTYRSHDWLEVAKFELFARRSILEDHRWPLWNPLLGGGTPQLAHPSDGSASPLILASLLLGPVLGMKVVVALVALLGSLGIYALARRTLALAPPAALVAASCLACSGWLPARVAVGFYESCLMVAWPAILALWWWSDGPSRRAWALGAALLAALAIQLQLALPILVLWMALVLGADALLRLGTGEALPKARAGGALAILAVAGLLGAIKFVPMVLLLGQGDFREASLYPTHPDAWLRNFEQLWYGLLHHVPGLPLTDADGNPRVQEYVTLQPGLGGLLLLPAGLIAAVRDRRTWPWLAAGAALLWMAFGPHAPVDGFRPLHGLPLFGSMRGPLRYLSLPVLVTICLLAGVGAQALPRRGVVAALAVVLCLVTGADARTLYRTSFVYTADPLPPPAVGSEGLRTRSLGLAGAINLRKYSNVARGLPTIYMAEDLPLPVGAVPAVWVTPDGPEPEARYQGEAFATDPDGLARGAARPDPVRIATLRAQEVVVEHRLGRPGLVVVNQNASDGWTCDRPLSPEYARWTGRLTFEAPAGAETTICRWRQRGLGAGAAGSALGLGLLVGLWRGGSAGQRPGRRPGRRR